MKCLSHVVVLLLSSSSIRLSHHKRLLKNIVGIMESSDFHHFLISPSSCSMLSRQNAITLSQYPHCRLHTFILDKSKILTPGPPLALNILLYYPAFLTTLNNKALENIVGKGENAGYQRFLLLPKCFLSYQKQFFYQTRFNLWSANALNLDQSNILSFGKELIQQFRNMKITFENPCWSKRQC